MNPSEPASVAERLVLQRGSLCVTENTAGLRTLRFGREGVRQSVAFPENPKHLELAYCRVVVSCFAAFAQRPGRALVLGLGGGSIPRFLRLKFPEWQIDVAESEQAVIDTARQCFGFREDKRLAAYHVDGRMHLASHENEYDIVILDAYDEGGIPGPLGTAGFFEQLKRSLRNGGRVIAHVWDRRANPHYDRMLAGLRKVFGEAQVLSVPNAAGKIVIGGTPAVAAGDVNAILRARRFAEENHFTPDLARSVRDGLSVLSDNGAYSRPLEDPS